MKRNLLFIIALFVCALTFGQGELDAYRYSSSDLSGTARGQAMGGAFGALGGDMTGVAINPAGIGVYRSSEIVANMSLTSPIIRGITNSESNTSFHFDNLSYVGYYPIIKGSMLSLNFGFNYNRIKSFDQRYSASGSKMNASLTDYMAYLTNGINHSTWDNENLYKNPNIPWLSILAWDGYLINPGNGNNDYSSLLDPGEQVSPNLKVSEKGQIETYDFTIGSNISNKFYWGATITITELSYLMNSSYDESFLGPAGGGFTLENFLKSEGSGIQFKAGIIYRPTDVLRLGLSYHSPTWYTMTDYFRARLTPRGIYGNDGKLVEYTETPTDDDNTTTASTNYILRTPGRWTLSAAAVLSTQAILSLDYEITNYASMNLKDDNGNDWKDVNSIINEDFKNTSTIRTGFELRFTPQFSGRIGAAWSQNPYQSDIKSLGDIALPAGTIPNYTLSDDVYYITSGVGFRFTPQFYMDFALVYRTQKDYLYYFPTDVGIPSLTDSFAGTFTNKTLKGLLTFGYKF